MAADVAFVKRLVVLAEVFNEPLSDIRIGGYWAALSDLPLPDLFAAMDHALKTSKFFPRPAELREAAEDLAWTRRQRELDAHPPVVRRLSEGDAPVSSERIEAFFRELRDKVKAMPGPAPRRRRERDT